MWLTVIEPKIYRSLYVPTQKRQITTTRLNIVFHNPNNKINQIMIFRNRGGRNGGRKSSSGALLDILILSSMGRSGGFGGSSSSGGSFGSGGFGGGFGGGSFGGGGASGSW